MSADILSPYSTGGHAFPAAVGDFSNVLNLSFTTSLVTASTTIDAALITLTATADCWISVGSSPTVAKAGSSSFFLPAKTVLHLALPDSTQKISVIGDSASGTLSVLPAAKG